ncbi:MAG: tetratricopeptide repeat protein [Nitrospiraceae bacterium]|nr:tetratricopeptide repeat protein [Nitrospiraceae bacterium]
MRTARGTWLLAFLVAALTIAVFLPALRNGFVNWDDDLYVYNNLSIRSLDWHFVFWAFTDSSVNYWHPLAWISHAVDYAVWGLDPRGHHLTSVLLHAANAFLVVVLIARLLARGFRTPTMAGSREGSPVALSRDGAVLVAAGTAGLLFGLHPLHVESVAWVSERKDVLCSFFFLLALISYAEYAGRSEGGFPVRRIRAVFTKSYLCSLLFFLLAVASKPMAITLPAVFLILDGYPYGRVDSLRSLWRAVVEKTPFLLVSLILSGVTYFAQQKSGSVVPLDDVSLSGRILAAFHSVIFYLLKMALPIGLSPVYSSPAGAMLSFSYGGAAVLTVAITIACIRMSSRAPLFLAVWSFYLITLLPVLGLVKVGAVSVADRYTYLPSLGPFLLLGLAASRAWMIGAAARGAVLAGGVVIACLLGVATVSLIPQWRNGIALWSAVLIREPGNFVAHINRGIAYQGAGDLTAALEDFNAAIASNPRYADAYTSRGWLYQEAGRQDLALQDYDRAIAVDPSRPVAFNNRGQLFQEQGLLDRAEADYTAAIAGNGSFVLAYVNRGTVREQEQRLDEAIADFSAAIRADPFSSRAYIDRGLLYERMGRLDSALADLDRAVMIDPAAPDAYNNRGLVLEDLGRYDQAIENYGKAISLAPGDYLAYDNRGIALAKLGRHDEAAADFRAACRLGDPVACRIAGGRETR